jgi:hypothetical protein
MTGRTIYNADDTGQMQGVGVAGPFVLEIHELAADGMPVCGLKPYSSWRGKPMGLVRLGRGRVTCKRCARVTDH